MVVTGKIQQAFDDLMVQADEPIDSFTYNALRRMFFAGAATWHSLELQVMEMGDTQAEVNWMVGLRREIDEFTMAVQRGEA